MSLKENKPLYENSPGKGPNQSDAEYDGQGLRVLGSPAGAGSHEDGLSFLIAS
jgi:hypothetical protein